LQHRPYHDLMTERLMKRPTGDWLIES
jgi:hypothetical protein